MKYQGSKRRIAKFILPYILQDRRPGQWYVEPFVGGSNLIDKVKDPRLGNDIHYYLIELSRALQAGWLPPRRISRLKYLDIKQRPHMYHPALVGYAGFQLSFGAKWQDTYCRDRSGKRNYSVEAFNNVARQAPKLKNIIYTNLPYWKLSFMPNSIIYCDPPYQNATNYSTGAFDYRYFWAWCREQHRQGHRVFVSERSMPPDFTCIWSGKIKYSLHSSTHKGAVEKLFTLK